MNNQSVYKSLEGKQEIMNFYNSAMDAVDYDYKEVYVDTSYGKTYLFEAGDSRKPSIFLFHGSCSNSAMWYNDIKFLSKHFHVYSVDVLGEPGKSDENRLDLKTDDHAHWINEILNSLKIDSAMFIGNSLGAWIIQKFAINYPEKAEKLVLIAPSGISNPKFSYLFKTIVYVMQGEKGMAKLGQLIYGKDDMPEIVLTFNKLILDHFNPIMGGLPTFSDEEMSKLTMPTLFMCGEYDAINDANKMGKRLQMLLNQPTIDIVKDNGHIIYNAMDKIIPYLKGET